MKKRWSILILSAMLVLTGCAGQNDKEPETLPVSVEAELETVSGALEIAEKTEENKKDTTEDSSDKAKVESTTEISSNDELESSEEATTSTTETESESEDEIQTQTEEVTDDPEPVEATADVQTSAFEPPIPPASEPQPAEPTIAPTMPSILEPTTVPIPTTAPEPTSIPVPTMEPEPTTVPEPICAVSGSLMAERTGS